MDIPYSNNLDVLRKCTEILPFTIYVFDFNDNKFIYTNRNFEDIIGYSLIEAEKILSLPALDVFHPDDVQILADTFQEIKSGKKKHLDITYRVRQKNGIYKWLHSRKIVFEENSDGTTRQYLGISEDVSEKKKIEEELIQAKESLEVALASKERFFSIISHEIRTPLNAIIGMIHLLQQTPAADNQPQIVDTLKFSSDNLMALIDDILDFSKMQAGKLEFEEIDFDVRTTLEHTTRLYNNKALDKGIRLNLQIDDDVPQYIKGDSVRLSQILNNLVSNAIKFTNRGSVSLFLKIHGQTKSEITLLFEVTDTGIGIPANKLKTIFEPYQQSNKDINRRFGGTGLGLSIIKNLVNLQKGTVKVQSKVNEGSTFQVKLKFKKSAEVIKKITSFQSQTALNLKVLYVEDVVPNQFLMRGYFSHWNIDMDVASTGEEAVEIIQNKNYDLILMDIQMPGIDGYEATQKIRSMPDKYFRQVPVLAVSASIPDMSSEKIRKAGMNGYILKPINPEKMYKMLTKYANKKTQEPSRIKNATVMKGLPFSKLDYLYRDQVLEYQHLLKVMKEQFEDDKILMVKAILEKDDTTVAKIRHRSLTTMITLQQQDFIRFLKEIKALEDRKESEIRDIATHVFHRFDEVIALIKYKFTTLQQHNTSVSS